MKNIINKKWFTLIEMLISITIFTIMTVMVYANYAFYQNISKVKLWLKEISQNIHDAKNMAINWYDKNKVNQSIWIYFDLNNKNTIKYYAFDYNKPIILDDSYVVKEKNMQEFVWISKVWNENNLMIYFSSIYWEPKTYYFDWAWEKKELSANEIDFIISFKDAEYFPLKRELKYFLNTNVVDY